MKIKNFGINTNKTFILTKSYYAVASKGCITALL